MATTANTPETSENSEIKIKSIKKMMDVLNCFTEKQPLGVTEISEKLGLYKSNVHNILNTMAAMDYLEQDALSGKYYLGLAVIKLSQSVGDRFSFHAVAQYHMQMISAELDETVYLCVPIKGKVYYLDAAFPNSMQSVIVSNYRDTTECLHCTGSGKIMLSYMSHDEQEEYLSKPLERRTENTITDPEALRTELYISRERGYAIDNMEAEANTRCVAVVIRRRDGTILGSMSISGSAERITLDKIPRYAEILKAHIHDIEDKI